MPSRIPIVRLRVLQLSCVTVRCVTSKLIQIQHSAWTYIIKDKHRRCLLFVTSNAGLTARHWHGQISDCTRKRWRLGRSSVFCRTWRQNSSIFAGYKLRQRSWTISNEESRVRGQLSQIRWEFELATECWVFNKQGTALRLLLPRRPNYWNWNKKKFKVYFWNQQDDKGKDSFQYYLLRHSLKRTALWKATATNFVCLNSYTHHVIYTFLW